MNTKITIVTVTRNASYALSDTIESVSAYYGKGIRHIIIDGGDDDETRILINKHKHDDLFWVREKDYGVYDAMNKAFNYIENDSYVAWINSGDILLRLPEINIRKGVIQPDILLLSVMEINHLDQKSRLRKPCYDDSLNLSSANYFKYIVHHQGFMIKKSIILSSFDEGLGDMADSYFMMQHITLPSVTVKAYPDTIFVQYITGGISDKPSVKRLLSHYKVIKKLGLSISIVAFANPYRFIRAIIRQIIPYTLFKKYRYLFEAK